jgi:hypothetical protein
MKQKNIIGKTFGLLFVKEQDQKSCGKEIKYICECMCGNQVSVSGNNLRKGHTKSCGCLKLADEDIVGKQFGQLTVLSRSNERKVRGKYARIQYQCRCDCGKILLVYRDSLINEDIKSCGCLNLNKDIPENLRQEFIEGTQISKIQNKITKANKSGIVGVNWDKSRKKWMAGIRFKGHRYNLGYFDNLEDAAKIRQEAEKQFFGEFLEWYSQQVTAKLN